jgi:hypothetical protein
VENVNRVFWIFWDKEEGMERANGDADMGYVIAQEL